MKEDKRKNNGGNSTKSTGPDKRKNDYRKAIDEAVTNEDVVKVILKFKDLFIDNDDLQAGKIFLENVLSKPTQGLDVTSNGETVKSIDPIKWIED